MMREMKAGPELDMRLCDLLEETPTWDGGKSPLGFWEWDAMDETWGPAPVSTDWAAAGKVVDEIKRRDFDIFASYMGLDNPKWWRVTLSWTQSYDGYGDKFPHALALATCEALEKRAEAKV